MRRLLRLGLVLALVLTSGAFAATWIVDQGGGGDATTIQGGVDLASDGDEVIVRAGTYGEQVDVDKSLTITGESGAAATVVDAEDVRGYCVRSAGAVAGGAILSGLTLTGVNGSYGFCTGQAAVDFNGPLTLVDCVVEDNLSPWATMVVNGPLTLIGTRFSNNRGIGAGCGSTDPDHGVGCATSYSITAENCLFEGNGASDTAIADVQWGAGVFRNCVFRGNNVYGNGGLFVGVWDGGSVELNGNLFVDHDYGSLFGERFYGGGAPTLANVHGNTFARNGPMFVGEQQVTSGSIFHGNVFTGSEVGLSLPNGGAGIQVTCNDSWGNTTNWSGFNPAGGGNFSQEPKFCAPHLDDFTVASNSPLLASGNFCGEPIGAFGVGCGPISIEATSWGRVKSLYRGQ